MNKEDYIHRVPQSTYVVRFSVLFICMYCEVLQRLVTTYNVVTNTTQNHNICTSYESF